MDIEQDDIVVAEGPLFLLWYTQDMGGHSIYAQYNGFTFDLYSDEAKTVWFGEAELVDDVAVWAWDLLVEYGRVPAEPRGRSLAHGQFRGSWG